MGFNQIYNDGTVARTMGQSLRENPYYRSENLPVSESAAVYRAWQIKAEAWEQGWREQDEVLSPVPRRVSQPLSSIDRLSIDRRATPLTARVQDSRVQEGERQRTAVGGVAA